MLVLTIGAQFLCCIQRLLRRGDKSCQSFVGQDGPDGSSECQHYCGMFTTSDNTARVLQGEVMLAVVLVVVGVVLVVVVLVEEGLVVVQVLQTATPSTFLHQPPFSFLTCQQLPSDPGPEMTQVTIMASVGYIMMRY